MVDNTLASVKNRRPASSSTVANQIVKTCVILLDTIPEVSIQKKIVNDLILLLSDLDTLYNIGILDNDNEGIQVVLFPSLQQDGQKELCIDLTTVTGLLLLQTNVYQILLQLFIMKYYHNQDMVPIQEEEGRKESLDHESIQNTPLLMNEENKRLLLQCIRHYLETWFGNTANRGDSSLAFEIFSLQSKEAVCNLLCLILPEYSIQVNSITLGRSRWTEMMDLVTSAVRTFMLHHGSWGGQKGSNDRVLRHHRDSVSRCLSILLRNIFVVPPHPCDLFAKEMWSMRSLFVTRLLDCTRYMTSEELQEHDASIGVKKLHRMILQAIVISLYPTSTISCSQGESDMFDVREVMQMCFTHCNINNLWPSLFSLVKSSHFTIASAILTRLSRFYDEYAVDRACQIVLSGETKKCNKRRKIHRDSTCNLRDLQDGDSNDTNVTSFVLALADYLSMVLDGARETLSIDVETHSLTELKKEIQFSLLDKENVSAIFNSIYLIIALSGIRQDTEYDRYCRIVLEKLLRAATNVTEILIAISSDDNVGDLIKKYYDQLSNISWAMSRMLLQYVLNAKNSYVGLEELALMISKWTTLHLSQYPPPDISAIASVLDLELSPSLLVKSSPSVDGVPLDALKFANEYLASYYKSCSNFCGNLEDIFGVTSCCNKSRYECMCHLICNQGNQPQQKVDATRGDMELSNLSCIVLLEDVLSTRIRYVIS
jgi:hypothetical protein